MNFLTLSMKKQSKLFLRVFLACLLLVLISLNACSSKSSLKGGKFGKGGGFAGATDGVFSDEDLALAERNYADGNIPLAQGGSSLYGGRDGEPFADIKFSYDSSSVPQEYREQLERDSVILREDQSLKLEIEGHCDARGTNEYNLALGKSRAKAVAKYLVNLGVNPTQLSTITYGEEIPLQIGESESAFSENRRAHFAVFRSRASLGAEDTSENDGSYRSDPYEDDANQNPKSNTPEINTQGFDYNNSANGSSLGSDTGSADLNNYPY